MRNAQPSSRLLLAWGVMLGFGGCGGGGPAASFQTIAPLTAVVGVELDVNLSAAATTPNDAVSFSVTSADLPDLTTRMFPATVSSFANGMAVFRWTPLSRDQRTAPYTFAFHVTSGGTTTTQLVQVTVNQSTKAGPTFHEPLGTGTTLDLTVNTCVQVQIVVQDSDANAVSFHQEQPQVAGAQLTSTGPFTATWRWCPSDAQKVGAQTQYQFVVSADDGVAPKRLRAPYLVVLRQAASAQCAGNPPVITDTPLGDQSSVQDFVVSAQITDDIGLKGSPLLYYSTIMPATQADIYGANFTVVAMAKQTDGSYQASIPNPVANAMAAASADIYYVISAQDADDPTGKCDHTTLDPDDSATDGSGMVAYHFTVMRPAVADTAPTCGSCTDDSQCAAGSYCVEVEDQETFCLPGCGFGDPACSDATTTCSFFPYFSTDDHLESYCYPNDNRCVAISSDSCPADALEENDGQTSITNATSLDILPAGETTQTYSNLTLCPAGAYAYDEDWYRINATSGTFVAAITGNGAQDLDIDIDDDNGNLVGGSYGPTDVESACAQSSGPLFVRVYPYSPPNGSFAYDQYSLTVSSVDSCP